MLVEAVPGGWMRGSGTLHGFRVHAEMLEPVLTLRGGHTDTVRCVAWDVQRGQLLSGGEDGQLCYWANSTADAGMAGDPAPGPVRHAVPVPAAAHASAGNGGGAGRSRGAVGSAGSTKGARRPYAPY